METKINNQSCERCTMLMELYEGTEQNPRQYWVMTELFVMLHGGDICKPEDFVEVDTSFEVTKLL